MKLSIRGVQLVDDCAKWHQIPIDHKTIRAGEKLYAHFSSQRAAENRAGVNIPNGAAGLLFDGVPSGGASASARKESDDAARAKARMMEPMIDAMVSNPRFVDSMIAMQPELKRLIDEHPHVEQELRNPETLKQMMMSQIDPDQRRQLNRTMQLQMAHLSNIPGGTAMLEKYMSRAMEQPEGKRSAADLRDVVEEHSRPDPALASNAAALPNPWARRQAEVAPPAAQGPPAFPFRPPGWPPMSLPTEQSRAPLGGGSGWPFFPLQHGGQPFVPQSVQRPQAASAPAASTSSRSVANEEEDDTDYSAQLVTMLEMGFEDDEACLRALKACHGDIDAAVCFLDDERERRGGGEES